MSAGGGASIGRPGGQAAAVRDGASESVKFGGRLVIPAIALAPAIRTRMRGLVVVTERRRPAGR